MDDLLSRSDWTRSKAAIAGRLRLIRSEIFGEHGGPELAEKLGLPFRTWFNYETGVTIPGEIESLDVPPLPISRPTPKIRHDINKSA